MKPLRPLKRKLIESSLIILGLSFLVAGVLVFFGIDKVSQGIVGLVQDRAKDTKEALIEFSESSSSRIKENFTKEIKQRSLQTIEKDAASLTQLFQDNSFLQIKDFLNTVFKDDENILRATFLVLDRKKIVAWHYVDRDHLNGLDFGTIYDSATQSWLGRLASKNIKIVDPQVADIIKTNSVQIVDVKLQQQGRQIEALDTYIPVYSAFKDLKQLEHKTTLARAQGNPIGFLRYTVSLETMKKSIEEEQASLNSYISKIEKGNQAAVLETQTLSRSLQSQTLMYLTLAIFLLIILSYFVTRFISNKITIPINKLIQTAQKISAGNFKHQVEVYTDDEVGILANTIQEMSFAIQERDRKLESYTQNLEQLVEKRTQELDQQKAVSIQASKMAALGEMAGGMAHEINTPLCTLSLNIETLLDSIDAPKIELESMKKALLTNQRVIARIAKIIQGLRSFSRDASKDDMTLTSVETLIQDTISLCSEKFKSAAVKLSVSEINTDWKVMCRPAEINQVLLNLLNNSYDAIQNLFDKWIRIEVEANDKEIIISVTDCGLGIPEQIQAKIMQPFFTTKDIGKGTGLGLSISKGIIESHGGRFELDKSCPNTRFFFTLPKT